MPTQPPPQQATEHLSPAQQREHDAPAIALAEAGAWVELAATTQRVAYTGSLWPLHGAATFVGLCACPSCVRNGERHHTRAVLVAADGDRKSVV